MNTDVRCPACGGTQTTVRDSRPQEDMRRRNRKCLECGASFATVEIREEIYKKMCRIVQMTAEKGGNNNA